MSSWVSEKAMDNTKKVFERQVLSDAKLTEEQSKRTQQAQSILIVAIWRDLFIMPGKYSMSLQFS